MSTQGKGEGSLVIFSKLIPYWSKSIWQVQLFILGYT